MCVNAPRFTITPLSTLVGTKCGIIKIMAITSGTDKQNLGIGRDTIGGCTIRRGVPILRPLSLGSSRFLTSLGT